MKKLYVLYRLLPGFIFCLMVFWPFAANIFFSNTELLDNRPLHEKPTRLDKNFSRDYEAYYNDTFAGRKKLVSKYIKLQQKLKIDTGQYFYGDKGWMFYDSVKVNNGNTMVDYYGEVRFDEDELKAMAEGINKAADFYAARGAKYLIVIAPNKEGIYSEYMPERMQRARSSDKSRMDAAVEYLKKHTKAVFVNLKKPILEAKNDFPYRLYFKKDTHWNNIGAYIGFEAIAHALNGMGYRVPLKPLTPEMITESGKQHVDMHPEAMEMNYRIDYLSRTETDCAREEGEQYVFVCKNKGTANGKKLMVLGDSFAGALMPFLNKAFSETVNAPAGNKKLSFYEELMQKYQPDVVADELIERYFSRYINYGRIFSGHYDD